MLGAVLTSKELQNSTNILVFNLALADLFVSGFVDTFTFVGKISSIKFISYLLTSDLFSFRSDGW